MAVNNKDIDPELLQRIRELQPSGVTVDQITESAKNDMAERAAQIEKMFPGINKWTLGYSDIVSGLLEHLQYTSKDNYPFHNITAKYVNENGNATECIYEITMSVAGFGKDDISVEVFDNVLYVDGTAPAEPDKYVIKPAREDKHALVVTEAAMYSGIAARDFHRTFLMGYNMEVVNAIINNGTLTITVLEKYTPTFAEAIKGIEIEVKEATPRIPILYIDKAEPNPSYPGAEIVYVYCDECLKYHTHGMPNGNDGTYEPSHRSPHCIDKNGKYSNTGYMIAYKKIVGA